MGLNSEGFLEPMVDETICTSCGACRKACPLLNEKGEDRQIIKNEHFFASWTKNKHLLHCSSSGGIFGEIASLMIKKGGSVYGAAWFRGGIKHIRCTTKDEIKLLLGSKYGQSDIGLTFRQVKDDLRKGIKVLFTGTPCQIAGLHSYLNKAYDNLLTADIICHGVPTRFLEEKYLKEEEIAHGEATEMAYRDKSDGWRSYSIRLTHSSGKRQVEGCYHSRFMRGFISDISLNTSCYKCPFTLGTYQSDITLGDCWGASKYLHPFWNHQGGISLIAIHTDKGLNTINSLRIVRHQISLDTAISFNGTLNKAPMEKPLQREQYIQELRSTKPLKDINNMYLNGFRQKFDVAILGLWMSNNYGGLLTSYALYKVVLKLGKSAVLLDHQYSYPYLNDTNAFGRFLRSEHPARAAVPTLRSLRATTEGIHTLLVGSDQVWHPVCGYEHYFFLDFAQASHRKIAYASSFGNSSHMYHGEYLQRSKAYLQRFDAISVREDSGLKLLHDTFGIDDATHLLDPVFLCDEEFWEELSEKEEVRLPREPYLLSYILNPTEEKQTAIAATAEQRGLRHIIYIFDAGLTCPPLLKHDKISIQCLQGVSVYQWLSLIKNASHVITDSFHGCCFAVIFKKQFHAIGNTWRGLDRFLSLVRMLDIPEVLTSEDNPEFKSTSLIDYTKLGLKLRELRRVSVDWLSAALNDDTRTEEKQQMNESIAAQLPPYRNKRTELRRLLMRKFPRFFKTRDSLKKALAMKAPRLFMVLKKIKRSILR